MWNMWNRVLEVFTANQMLASGNILCGLWAQKGKKSINVHFIQDINDN